jgi:hypothetical protein
MELFFCHHRLDLSTRVKSDELASPNPNKTTTNQTPSNNPQPPRRGYDWDLDEAGLEVKKSSLCEEKKALSCHVHVSLQ